MPMAANLLLQRISSSRMDLTPKARLIGDFILNNPRKVIFMTTRELSRAARVSEATVIRFVNQLGYKGYGDFLQELRDIIDTELTLIDRVGLTDMKAPESERFRRVVYSEIDNLKQLHESLDLDKANRAVELLRDSSAVYVVGSRLSYTFAYYLGWSLTKIRTKVHILRGSDSTCIDFLTIAPEESLVVIFATTRYPNELIRLGKLAKRLGQTLLVITDGALCPLIPFADLSIIAPSRHIPLIGSPTTLSCLINLLVVELAARCGADLKLHQEKLEKVYLENDVLFNLR
jgi:DNA-binding MurR/RpiR family transcriptional regulator